MIEDIHDRDLFIGNKTRIFDLLKDSLSGASDIDLCYERNRKILILEHKLSDGKLLRMKVGQWLMLKRLSQKEKVYVYCIAESNDSLGYKLISFHNDALIWKDDILSNTSITLDISTFPWLSSKDINKVISSIVSSW